MTNKAMLCAAVAVVSLSACGQSTKTAQNTVQTNNVQAASASPTANQAAALPACAPGGETLPVTGLCQERAAALLLSAGGSQEQASDGCTWVVNEAKILDNGALLYRALRCNGRTAKLEFLPGARAASFELAESPWGPQPRRETVAAQFDAGNDANATILEVARRVIEDPAEKARCQVRRLAIESSPADALVVDEVPAPPEDGVRSACGEFGYDGGAQTYWRVSQGSAWFFTLGNDSAPVDAASFTLLSKGADGQWVRS